MGDLFLLSEAQMARLSPHFPLAHGVPRVDDRRVVSGIVYVIRNGLQWKDAPKDYGPHKTLYNRFIRWSGAFNYVCFEVNPLLGAIRESRTRYRFSDFAPFTDSSYGTYWDAMSEAGIADAICATSYGSDRSIASLHLGFSRRTFSADEARQIHMAGLLLTERLMEFEAPAEVRPALTTRERDCLAFVADGYTDVQIAMLLDVSESTVRFHLTNARTKLGAVNRAQAVARLATSGLL